MADHASEHADVCGYILQCQYINDSIQVVVDICEGKQLLL